MTENKQIIEISEDGPGNIIGQIMKRVAKRDKILFIGVGDNDFYSLLQTLRFDVIYFDLKGESPFDFKSETFDKLISVDCIPCVTDKGSFIKDCLRTIVPKGYAFFFFHISYATKELKLFLKTIKCQSVLRRIPSNLKRNMLDTSLLEIQRCEKKADKDSANNELDSMADSENKSVAKSAN